MQKGSLSPRVLPNSTQAMYISNAEGVLVTLGSPQWYPGNLNPICTVMLKGSLSPRVLHNGTQAIIKVLKLNRIWNGWKHYVHTLLSTVSIGTPACRSISTTDMWPLTQAQCIGLGPSSDLLWRSVTVRYKVKYLIRKQVLVTSKPVLTLTPTGYYLSTLLNATECSVPKHEPCQMQQYAMGNSAIT